MSDTSEEIVMTHRKVIIALIVLVAFSAIAINQHLNQTKESMVSTNEDGAPEWHSIREVGSPSSTKRTQLDTSSMQSPLVEFDQPEEIPLDQIGEYEMASMSVFGFMIPSSSGIETVYQDLLDAADSGNNSAALKAARIASTCASLRKDETLIHADAHPFHMLAIDCHLMADVAHHTKARHLIEQAAQRGYREAILMQSSHPPLNSADTERLDWEITLESRLLALNLSPDSDAALTLAQAYDHGFHHLSDTENAISFFRRFIELAEPGDPRIYGVNQRLSALVAEKQRTLDP